MNARKVVISGYCTVDYVVRLKAPFHGIGTVEMTLPDAASWPRFGGAVLHAGWALARKGHHVAPLSRLGRDHDGDTFLTLADERGFDVSGFELDAGAPTSRCLLLYHTDESTGCLLERHGSTLTPIQRALAGKADLIVITAGDPEFSRQLLEMAPPNSSIAWIAKNDPACFPPLLRRLLAERADVIFCARAERDMVEGTRGGAKPSQILFETRGAEGGVVESLDREYAFPASPVPVADATGAGDTFAGAALAALLAGHEPLEAARHGAEAARSFLIARTAHG